MWVQFGLRPATVAASAALCLAPIIKIAHTIWWATQVAASYGKTKQRELQDQHTRLQETIAALTGELSRVDANVRLTEFLRDRASGDRYAKYRGIVGEVSNDLKDLDRYLRESNEEWSANNFNGSPPIQRVILYIDDLDRCRPERVVETLEAIHLLLAIPLFIVVVGVDARWLLQSLQHHHATLFSPLDAGRPRPQSQVEMTLDYLDKIFQIPYALRPMGDHAEGYIRELLEPLTDFGNLVPGDTEDRPRDDGQAFSLSTIDQAKIQSAGTGEFEETVPQAREFTAEDARKSRGEATDSQLDLNPSSLQFRTSELEFMSRLGPVLPTPRVAKKFVNLYRLVRIGIPEGQIASFIGGSGGGPCQIVLILLALVVGNPGAGALVLTAIEETTSPEETIEKLLLDLAASGDPLIARYLCQYADLLEQIRKSRVFPSRLGDYRTWLPVVARLSFFTAIRFT